MRDTYSKMNYKLAFITGLSLISPLNKGSRSPLPLSCLVLLRGQEAAGLSPANLRSSSAALRQQIRRKMDRNNGSCKKSSRLISQNHSMGAAAEESEPSSLMRLKLSVQKCTLSGGYGHWQVLCSQSQVRTHKSGDVCHALDSYFHLNDQIKSSV